jgi:hypothetical protein
VVDLNIGGGPIVCPATANDCAAITSGNWDVAADSMKILDACGGTGFEINPSPGINRGLRFKSIGGCKVNGVLTAGGAAPQTVDTDMLNFYFLQIDPQGQSTGNITIKLWNKGNTTITPDDTRTVPVSSNATTLANAIVTALNASTTGIHAGFVSSPQASRSFFHNETVNAFVPGIPIVEVNNAGAKLELVQVSSGNIPVVINNSTEDSFAPVPILNPWGMTLLVLVILLSTAWLIRRRNLLKRA